MKAHCEVADQLGDMLGKNHDLESVRSEVGRRRFRRQDRPGGTDGLGSAPAEDNRGGGAFDWGSATRRVPRKLAAPVAILLECLAPEPAQSRASGLVVWKHGKRNRAQVSGDRQNLAQTR